MGARILNIWKQYRFGLAAVAALGLTLSLYNIYVGSSSLKKLSVLESGIQTCFTRVQQTFMANMLGSNNSMYLSDSFTQNTEDCFADANQMVGSLSLVTFERAMNTLSNGVHWFHQKVSRVPLDHLLNNEGDEAQGLGQRFSNLEIAKIDALNSLSQEKGAATSRLSWAIALSGGLLILCGALLALMGFRGRKENELREEVEAEALVELKEYGALATNRVRPIIEGALRESGYKNTMELFGTYHENLVSGNFIDSEARAEEEVDLTPELELEAGYEDTIALSRVEAAMLIEQAIEEQNSTKEKSTLQLPAMKFVENEDDIVEDIFLFDHAQSEVLSVEKSISYVIDSLSKKLFTQGILLNLNIDQEKFIYAQIEQLEQVVYHSVLKAVSLSEGLEGERKVNISQEDSSGLILVKIQAPHTRFDDTAIESFEKDLDLKIASELAKEIGASLRIENGSEEALIELTFRRADKPSKRVQEIHKGKKKDILKSMRPSL